MDLRPLQAWLRVIALAAAASPAASALAQQTEGEDPQSYNLMAVQNRRYFGTHELSVYGGLLPLDAFTKGATLSGSYTIHFSSALAWEVGHFGYSFQYDADLREELRAFELEATPFEVLDRFLLTNLVFKPVYWKGTWLNDSLIHGEFFGMLGGGVGWFTRSTRPGVDLGVGTRLYLSDLFSMRLDVRYLLFFEDRVLDFKLHDELWIGLGFALTL